MSGHTSFRDLIGPYKRWYQFGWRSPEVLYKRFRSGHRPILRLKWAWQRARRGYDDQDMWAINHTLAKLTVVGCRAMREGGHGYPSVFSEHAPGAEGGGWEKWQDILLRIETGFQAWLDDDWLASPENEAKYEDAMALYAKYFRDLWD